MLKIGALFSESQLLSIYRNTTDWDSGHMSLTEKSQKASVIQTELLKDGS